MTRRRIAAPVGEFARYLRAETVGGFVLLVRRAGCAAAPSDDAARRARS